MPWRYAAASLNEGHLSDFAHGGHAKFCLGEAAFTQRDHALFAGHADWFAPTDIHENPTGSNAIAHAVVDTMKAHCVAQPASSGCCEP